MLRSMIQMYIKESDEGVKFYQKVFGTKAESIVYNRDYSPKCNDNENCTFNHVYSQSKSLSGRFINDENMEG